MNEGYSRQRSVVAFYIPSKRWDFFDNDRYIIMTRSRKEAYMILLIGLILLGIAVVLFLFWGILSFIIALIVNLCKVGFGSDGDNPVEFWDRWKEIFTFGLYILP